VYTAEKLRRNYSAVYGIFFLLFHRIKDVTCYTGLSPGPLGLRREIGTVQRRDNLWNKCIIFFTIVFFCIRHLSVFRGLYDSYRPKSGLKQGVFRHMYFACFWSLGLFNSKLCPYYRDVSIMRRFSAIGWGSIYSLLLHYLLLLSGGKRPRKRRRLRLLLYLPAVVCIYVFVISMKLQLPVQFGQNELWLD
jgi:hypothetical protein